MNMFSVTLMFLAWLLYGAMPAMASFPAPVDIKIISTQQEHIGHDMPDMVAGGTASHDNTSGDPCPHRGGMKHVPFCAACLVLPPFIEISTLAAPVFASVKPGVMQALVAGIPAPPERPPRT